jgi:hypothetical protein
MREMKIDKSKIAYLWYENKEGKRWVPPKEYCGVPKPPEGFIYQQSMFPFQVHEVTLVCEENRSREICSGNSSWPEDLVFAMAKSGDFGLYQSIFIAANACSRCLNALSYKYLGPTEGYSEDSEEYKNCKTLCDYCRDD